MPRINLTAKSVTYSGLLYTGPADLREMSRFCPYTKLVDDNSGTTHMMLIKPKGQLEEIKPGDVLCKGSHYTEYFLINNPQQAERYYMDLPGLPTLEQLNNILRCQVQIPRFHSFGSTRQDGDQQKFWVTEFLLFESRVLNGYVLVPIGFYCDLASHPIKYLGGAPDAASNRAAILHDWLYATWAYFVDGRLTFLPEGDAGRELADEVLREALEVAGFGVGRRNIWYRAVRLGGSRYYKNRDTAGSLPFYWPSSDLFYKTNVDPTTLLDVIPVNPL